MQCKERTAVDPSLCGLCVLSRRSLSFILRSAQCLGGYGVDFFAAAAWSNSASFFFHSAAWATINDPKMAARERKDRGERNEPLEPPAGFGVRRRSLRSRRFAMDRAGSGWAGVIGYTNAKAVNRSAFPALQSAGAHGRGSWSKLATQISCRKGTQKSQRGRATTKGNEPRMTQSGRAATKTGRRQSVTGRVKR